MQATAAPTFLSAADSSYWRCLYQLLLGAARQGWDQSGRWIVYDLGMTDRQLEVLQNRFPKAEFRKLDLAKMAPHYLPAKGSYAWKPHIIWHVVEQAKGPVVWMDSANLPKSDPTPILDWVGQHGLYLLRGQAPLQERCDPNVLRKLHVPRWTWGMRECVSGVVGIDAARPWCRDLVRDWARLAETSEIIRPAKRSIPRHMNDQAVLNALIAEKACSGEITLPDLDVDISSARPVPYLSTRNKLKSRFPVWADPLARLYYGVAKALDQAAHRVDQWHGRTKVFLRMRSEFFQIRISKSGEDGFKPLKSPFFHYYADPFLHDEGGETWLFFEDYNYLKHRATIAAAPLNGTSAVREVLDPGCHASYPFLFRYQGRLFMLPETCRNRSVDLYECTGFPDQWVLRRTILADVDAADSVIFEHDNRWWLITSLESPNAGGMYRYLAIYHATDPIGGEWVAHPVNTEGLYIEAPRGTGRNAGDILWINGEILRPAQVSQDYYGQGMQYRRITHLSELEFAEEDVPTPKDLRPFADQEGVHHLSTADDRIVWDKRLRK